MPTAIGSHSVNGAGLGNLMTFLPGGFLTPKVNGVLHQVALTGLPTSHTAGRYFIMGVG